MITNTLINLTQHTFTAEQKEEFLLKDFEWVDTTDEVKALLTFTSRPTLAEMRERAKALVAHAKANQAGGVISETVVMCGGAPYFMPVLEQAFLGTGIRVVYAFTERVSHEVPLPDGSVAKSSVFKHVGFVPEL